VEKTDWKELKMSDYKPLVGKLVINGALLCLTGLHIGASKDTLEIGGVDSPVVRDPLTREPYIPGSSLKGKLRAILERQKKLDSNRYSGQGVNRHECSKPTCPVCRLFGSTSKEKDEKNLPARLAVRDLRLTTDSKNLLQGIDTGLEYTELKFENALDRVSAAANPRQIERVPAGSSFDFELVYTVETEDQSQIKEDLGNLFSCLRILEDDALGGHGSRGYGRVKIQLKNENPALFARKIDFYRTADAEEKKKMEKVVQAFSSLEEVLEKVDEIAAFYGDGQNV